MATSPAAPGEHRLRLLRRGDRDPAVEELRHVLFGDSAAQDSANREVFDDALDRSVRAFQQERGLTVDGIVGPETWRAIASARWRLGDRLLHHRPTVPFHGDDVLELQQRLLSLGFDTGRCDGWFGPRTESAVRDFQRNVGLGVDGTCGPLTLRQLTALRNTPGRGGRAHELREAEALRRGTTSLAGTVIVIDPGHGGVNPETGEVDHGWNIDGVCEAEVVADVASRFEGRLGAAGATSFLTRGARHLERPLTDADRAEFANSTDADLLISLHCDGHESDKPHGVATYYYGTGRDGGSVVGESLAGHLQRSLASRTDLRDCRSHARTLEILRATRMPAVRVELGYLTHPRDRSRLADPQFRDLLAEALLVGLQDMITSA